jgi:hypothetical protein
MGTLLDLASLVTIPSGYKVGTVYSVVPTDGAGDLTFTRSNDTATRVGPNGLIEKVRTNLQTSSQNFTAAGGWGGDPITATANYGTAPDGTTTSTRLQFSAANYVWQKGIGGLNGNLAVFSLYIKGIPGQTIQIVGGGVDNLITIGTGWTRVNTAPLVASSGNININTYGGNARDFEVWGGQTELGDIVTDYIPTTTTAVSVGPVANLPRLDYLNSTCPNLLLEPQRTNTIKYSEQLDNGLWFKETGNSITANSIASPDGYIDADTITATSGNVLNVNQSLTISTTGAHTFSAFLKKKNTSLVSIYLFTTHLGPQFVAKSSLNFDTGVVTTDFGTATLVNYGNGWYRLSVTGTLTATTTCTGGFFTDSTTGTRDVYAYGAQVELGAYATSYVPTLGAASTRGADASVKTGISSLIGQTEGTLFVQVQRMNEGVASGVVPLQLNDGTNNNRVQIEISSTGSALLIASSGGAVVANITGPTLTIGQTAKIAIAYKVNDFQLFVNGVSGGFDTSGAVPVSMSRLDIASEVGISYSGFRLGEAILFETRLSNAELAQLTTL